MVVIRNLDNFFKPGASSEGARSALEKKISEVVATAAGSLATASAGTPPTTTTTLDGQTVTWHLDSPSATDAASGAGEATAPKVVIVDSITMPTQTADSTTVLYPEGSYTGAIGADGNPTKGTFTFNEASLDGATAEIKDGKFEKIEFDAKTETDAKTKVELEDKHSLTRDGFFSAKNSEGVDATFTFKDPISLEDVDIKDGPYVWYEALDGSKTRKYYEPESLSGLVKTNAPECPFSRSSLKGATVYVKFPGLTEVEFTLDDFKTIGTIRPLHIAIKQGNLTVVTELLEAGADVNQANNNGDTALHIAVENGNLKVVTALLGNRASIYATNNGGASAEDYANFLKFTPV